MCNSVTAGGIPFGSLANLWTVCLKTSVIPSVNLKLINVTQLCRKKYL